ncbi:MAG: TatD family hydrolase [Candidatus Hodarchaeales archaeon]|jgi:TatD DNase family protein
MIDAHAHLLPDFMKNIEESIENAKISGLKAVINSAIEPHQFTFATQLARTHSDFIFTTLGFAPQRIKHIQFDESYKAISQNTSIVAIGEVGLDYHWIPESHWRSKQQDIFKQFIELANTLEKPLVIHSRKAESDCIDILERFAKVPVLMHCFAGNMSETTRVIDLGWMISIPTAVVNRKKHRKIARKAPLEHIVVETDSPFLSPIPRKRNEPANVKYAIEELAKLKHLTFEEVDKITTRNTEKLFNI